MARVTSSPTPNERRLLQAELVASADLASGAAGSGAALVGIQDEGDLFAANTVEAALAEAMAAINAINASVGSAIQPYDLDLAAIALLDTTNFGRSVLTAVDAAALRTALNLAPVAVSGSYTDLADTPLTALTYSVGDETTSLAVGTGVFTMRAPFAFTLTDVRASVTTAPTGSVIQVDVNATGASVFSTPMTIDAGERSSVDAAAPAVLAVTSLGNDQELSIDVDAVGSSFPGAGLKVALIGRPS